ncbi:MAG: acyltransferase [Chloroflexi bacterium]|nr:MAG: acyltransferase [Chloroflexota bacterium]
MVKQTQSKTDRRLPVLGNAIPRRGNIFTEAIGRLWFLFSGWRVVGTPPDLPKFVAIGAPHTSNWDFIIAMATLLALRLRLSWMGKHTLFKGPFGWLFYWLGGVPIDRRAKHGVVEQMADEFARREQFLLGIAPEGTRRKVDRWKTGFYRIAERAGVPIVPVALDYSSKSIIIGEAFYPTGDLEEDLARLQAFYANVTAKFPEKF